ncbi:MOSC domain-containing protein [Mitsuaria sp. WAJ17]|uniref:MOSC domain-containing protein n=1 Tax=Mitsuaria sp. WAJ17 TaxID=2761452 RepID=UPI001601DCC1|nr:MOSC domain-containing protein [Mitsuaria sp. WAJ17]MBB2488109.1 MOSC domain-containing protein [Mitsuaria sp. WAJ17]
MKLGSVAAQWCYPVKSMRGEGCASLRFDARGVVGDRLYAVRNAEGKFGSGKTTRRFRQMDGLLDFSARSLDGSEAPELQFPCGQRLRGDSPGLDEALSEALGQPVTLAREDEVSHLDAGPVHLLSSSSLQVLQAALPGTAIDARRFRPNLLIQCEADGPAEVDWIGRTLCLGPELRLQISAPTQRCGMVAAAQAGLAQAPELLRHLAQGLDMQFGLYARVLVPGLVRLGDTVILEP